MLKEQLEKIGLAEKEAKVFLAALELGSSAVQEIAKKADINRATTYVIIEKLMKKGLMSSVEKGKKTYFQTEDPKRLLKLLEEQEEGLKRKEEEFKKYLPELETLYNIAEEKPKVRFFEGKEGLETIKDEILKTTDKKLELFFSVDDLESVFSQEERKEYLQKRLAKKIKVEGIYTRTNGQFENVITGDEIRIVPKDKFPISVDLTIFNNKVAISSLKGKLIGVIIDNKEITNTLRSVFHLAWEAAEKYQKK